jgi:CheY-like chemotaxis protein
MTGTTNVLAVDNDADVRDPLKDCLSDHGYSVFEADGAETMRTLLCDLVLLGVGLAGEEGLRIARYPRERFDLGIIIVSGAGETADRIVGLQVGADDHVSDPSAKRSRSRPGVAIGAPGLPESISPGPPRRGAESPGRLARLLCAVVEPVGVAPGLLGAVHGRVGRPQQGAAVGAVLRKQAYPDAGGGAYVFVVQADRMAE